MEQWKLMDKRLKCLNCFDLRIAACVILFFIYMLVLPVLVGTEVKRMQIVNTTVNRSLNINIMNTTAAWGNDIKPRARRMINDEQSAVLELWMDHPDPPHSYATNIWWRLINHTIRLYHAKNCYVCAQFPRSTTGGDWWCNQVPDKLEISTVAVAASVFSTDTEWYHKNGYFRRIKVARRLFGQVATVRDVPSDLTCYSRSMGTHHLGKIPKGQCSTIYNETTNTRKTRRNCLRCLLDREKKNPYTTIVNNMFGNTASQQYVARHHLFYMESEYQQCAINCSTVHVPDEGGTGVLEEFYWLCGYRVFLSLPRNWTGLCALVQLHGGAIIIPNHPTNIHQRPKRGLFNLAQDSPVPKDHHIWTTIEQLSSVFSPAIGATSVMSEIQITRYELASFLDIMGVTEEGIKEELRGLRLTVLQNRLVLDQLTAASGGVCALIGTSCCTYVPADDADGHLIDEGMRNISLLTNTLLNVDIKSGTGWDWFKNVFANLSNVVLILVTTLILILLLLCLCLCSMKVFQRAALSAAPSQMVVHPVPRDPDLLSGEYQTMFRRHADFFEREYQNII